LDSATGVNGSCSWSSTYIDYSTRLLPPSYWALVCNV
jgi:hypothetical protein